MHFNLSGISIFYSVKHEVNKVRWEVMSNGCKRI